MDRRTTAGVAAVAVLASASGFLPMTGAAAAAPVRCTASALRVGMTDAEGGAGHRSDVLVFTNVSGHTCTLTGYPHVFVMPTHGKAIGAQRTLSGYMGGAAAVRTVTLKPRGAASAVLEGLGFRGRSGAACPTEKAVTVTAPQTYTPRTVRVDAGMCDDVMVHPVVAGRTGRSPASR